MDWQGLIPSFIKDHLLPSMALCILLDHTVWKVLNYSNLFSMGNLPDLYCALQGLSAECLSLPPEQIHNLAKVLKGKPGVYHAPFWAPTFSGGSWLLKFLMSLQSTETALCPGKVQISKCSLRKYSSLFHDSFQSGILVF